MTFFGHSQSVSRSNDPPMTVAASPSIAPESSTRSIPFGRPIIGEAEKAAVAEVLDGPILVHGPRAERFESDFADFAGGGRAVAVANCTAALHLANLHFGFGPGDEVLVPAQTHAATAHAVEFTGARPIFIDAEAATGNIDIAQIEAAITERTRAISVVHYLGLPVDMDRINAIAARHELSVIEDAALAVGATYKGRHVGLLGDCGCFSFYPVKHMTTAEGGILLTRHDHIAARVGRLRAFGLDRTVAERTMPGIYDVIMLGFNYRMNEMQAALGIEQLKRLPDFLSRRKTNYAALATGLAEIDELGLFKSSHGDFESSYYCMAVMLDGKLGPRRAEIVKNLKSQGVGSSVYYPGPVPHLTYYRLKYGFGEGDYPVARSISDRSIALPVGPHLDPDDMAYIVNAMKQAVHDAR